MKKRQLTQLSQFIVTRILLRLFIVFVLEKSFIEFILNYRLYLFIASISYFYYYSIEYEQDKRSNLIKNVLIYGNIYLSLHIFFRPLLNISHQLFVLLGLIILGFWRSSNFKSRWKYLFQIIGGIFCFFIMISGILYLYPDKPDIKGFLENKNNNLTIIGAVDTAKKEEAHIKLSNSKGNEFFGIQPNFSKILSENTKIAYPSLNTYRDEKIIITSSYGDLIQIFPQSEINLEFSGKELKKIEKLNGKIGFLSGMFDSQITTSGINVLSQKEQELLGGIQDLYKQELVHYLKNQISESKIGLANNTIMYNIDGIIIKFLSKMFPITFSKNMQNYNEFQKYFNQTDKQLNLSRFSMKGSTGESISSFLGNIQDNMNAGKNNIYGWFKIPKNR